MKVKELMTRDLHACGPGTRLGDAVWRMWEEDCRVLAVIERGRLVGTLSDGDVAAAPPGPPDLRVRDVMTRAAAVCRPDDDVEAALDLMSRRNVRRLPVVDARNRPLGTLTLLSVVVRRPLVPHGGRTVAPARRKGAFAT
jgi:CBS domain-containing protein